MASSWLNLLLGIALLQGAMSFGPIDDTSEEWVEYRNLMRSPEYRLPATTSPTQYQVHLTPHFSGDNQFTFDGEVSITITANQPNLQQIRLHCNDLTIDSSSVAVTASGSTANIVTPGQTFECGQYDFLNININQFLTQGQTYVVRILFKGNLQTNMRGFYRSWYNDAEGVRRWMGTTQFQPGHARQAFPCYDEPGFKARFTISITRDAVGFEPTLSNMPIQTTQTLENDKVRETFYTTPLTSTYLLAFIVSGYKRAASNNNNITPFHIYARDNIGANHADWSLTIGLPLLEVMDRYTGIPYYSMDPSITNMKMKQAAIPDFSAGAMENWGLLTYREALILYDPANSNHFYRQRIANIISHEIAHMWFGNLVTCAWWDNLWLNEGFARFYQYYLTGVVAPDMGYETRFITEQVHVSLLSDAAASAHPLTDPSVNDPVAVRAHFSTITYGKGACVLRMTQHLLGNNTYVTGLRKYLSDNRFGVAQPSDLFTALDYAATADNALSQYGGITVAQYFSTWTTQSGHPLLNVQVNHETGDMTVTQSRFYREQPAATEPASTSLWHIPITWTSAANPEFLNLKPTQIMTTQQLVIPRTTTGRQWVIFNKQQSGFYRVNYDLTTWNLITAALRGADRTLIHEYNRAQIVDDVFLLARSGHLTYSRALNILSFLKFEDEYAPWLAAITGFNFALRRLAHDVLAHNRLRNEIIELSTAIVARLGFVEPATGSSFMEDFLRMNVMTFLCNVGHPDCITQARTSFLAWRNGERIPPNMRPWVYCNGLRYGTSQDYDFFWSEYLKTDLANEQVVMITAAGCTQDQPSLNRYLANIVNGNADNTVVRAQDYSAAISSAVTSNEPATWRVFQWLQSNLQRAIATPGVVDTMISSITNRLLSETDAAAVDSWLTANAQTLGTSAVQTGRNGIANSRSNIAFYNSRVNEFNAYFETGFVDPDAVPTTTVPTTIAPTTTPEPTTVAVTTEAPTTTTDEPTTTTSTTASPTTVENTTPVVSSTTPDPNSATNLAAVSAITLIVTLVINMA